MGLHRLQSYRRHHAGILVYSQHRKFFTLPTSQVLHSNVTCLLSIVQPVCDWSLLHPSALLHPCSRRVLHWDLGDLHPRWSGALNTNSCSFAIFSIFVCVLLLLKIIFLSAGLAPICWIRLVHVHGCATFKVSLSLLISWNCSWVISTQSWDLSTIPFIILIIITTSAR